MKKILFLSAVLVSFLFSSPVSADSFDGGMYRKQAVLEVKKIAKDVQLMDNQYIALITLNEKRLKDIDAAKTFYKKDLKGLKVTLLEINSIYNMEAKAILNSHQYSMVSR